MALLVLDTTVLASYVLGDSSMRRESNRQPTDYESVGFTSRNEIGGQETETFEEIIGN